MGLKSAKIMKFQSSIDDTRLKHLPAIKMHILLSLPSLETARV